MKMLHTNSLTSQAKRLAFLLVPTMFLAGATFAQVGTPFVSITNTTTTPINFSDASSWAGSSVPGDSSNVTIANCYMTFDTDKVLGSVTISAGGYIDLGSSAITILDQFLCSQENGVYDAGGTSTVILKSTVADGGSGTVTVGGDNDVTFYNVHVFDGSVVDFDSGGDGNTETTITNELKMGGGSVVVNPPIYGGNSTLFYNEVYASVGTEWTAGVSSGKGVPHDVRIGGGNSLSFASTANDYTCTGTFTMNDAGASLDLSTMLGDLTVDEDFLTGASGAVTLTMPSAEGKGNLIVGRDMTVNANTTWSGDEGNVKVAGNLTNNASGAAFGLLELNGGAAQTVSSSGTLTVDSLVTNNSFDDAGLADGDVTITADVDITPGGVFNPIDGSVDVSGSVFTMQSDNSGTARIATLANNIAISDVAGDIVFERYVKPSDEVTWLAVGNYVVGATLGEWTSSASLPYSFMFQWDETHVLNNSESSNGASWWSTITGTNTVLEDSDYGYYVLMNAHVGGRTLTATGGYNTAQVDINATLSSGAFENGGWHLFTNPFPSPISGTQFLTDNSPRVSAYQIYDNASDVFTISGTTAPDVIDVGQSFWVQVGNAGNVSFTLNQLTSGTNSFVRTEDLLEEALVGVRVEQENGRNGTTYLRFHELGEEEFQWDLDVTYKHSGDQGNPEIYTQLDNGHELAINSMGTFDSVESIPLVVKSGSEGTVTFYLDEEFGLPSGVCMRIEDLETGAVAGLGGDPLVVNLEPSTVYVDRFVLTTMEAPEFASTVSHCEGGVVHFNGEDSGLWNIEWSDATAEIDGTGCVSGLDAGDYMFEATNPLNDCHTESSIHIAEVCMGDFNFNAERDITDLLILLVGIQPVENSEGNFPEADCDCDGAMTTLDLLMFLPAFGASCE